MKSLWFLPVAYLADVYGLLLLVPYLIIFAIAVYLVRYAVSFRKLVAIPVSNTTSHLSLVPAN